MLSGLRIFIGSSCLSVYDMYVRLVVKLEDGNTVYKGSKAAGTRGNSCMHACMLYAGVTLLYYSKE
jgi:hypothetical protein